MNQIGTRIHTLRKNKNLTQAQLAEALSVSAQSVSKWENNMSAPDISLLPVIARFFGITMDELFGYRLDALNYKERFIRFMADNAVLQFGSFHLRSGRISPYFINTGNYKSASQISKLGGFYSECMRRNNVESNLLAGNTRREIPIVLATSMALFEKYGADMNYTLDGDVGKKPESGDMATLIKDTLTSGAALKASLENSHELHVTDVLVSVDRMERGENSTWSARHEIEMTYGVRIHAIVTLDDIIRAVENGIVGGYDFLDAVKKYRDKYGGN